MTALLEAAGNGSRLGHRQAECHADDWAAATHLPQAVVVRHLGLLGQRLPGRPEVGHRRRRNVVGGPHLSCGMTQRVRLHFKAEWCKVEAIVQAAARLVALGWTRKQGSEVGGGAHHQVLKLVLVLVALLLCLACGTGFRACTQRLQHGNDPCARTSWACTRDHCPCRNIGPRSWALSFQVLQLKYQDHTCRGVDFLDREAQRASELAERQGPFWAPQHYKGAACLPIWHHWQRHGRLLREVGLQCQAVQVWQVDQAWGKWRTVLTTAARQQLRRSQEVCSPPLKGPSLQRRPPGSAADSDMLLQSPGDCLQCFCSGSAQRSPCI